MPFQNLVSKPWPELVAIAQEALKNQDILALQDIHEVVRYRFLGVMRRRRPVREFVRSLQKVLATREADEILNEADETETLLAQWDLLADLAEAEERGQELERNAVDRHVVGRPRRQQIFDMVSAKSEIRFQEMKTELGVSDANLSGLLGELEAHEILRRERRGSETWVRLGSAGIAHQKGNVVEMNLQPYRRAIQSVLPDEEWRGAVRFTA